MAPSVPMSLRLPDLKKLSVDANTGLCNQTAAVSLQIKLSPTPKAWENSTPKGEENESLRELDANSYSASVSKPEVSFAIIKNSLVPFHFLPLEWYHLLI